MKHIARSSLIVSIFFGIDKVFGLIRQTLVARQFALSYEIDVFNAANNIPDLLSALISGGALGVAMIPVLSEYLETKGRPEAWKLFSRIINLAFTLTGMIAIIIIIFARPLVENIIAPGFPEAQKQLTVELMRLDLMAIIIFSISGLVMAGLQANQHFLLPAMAPGLYNIGQIIGVTLLSPSMGIIGLVYGVILGAGLHLAIQIPGLIRFGFKWTAGLGLKDSGVRKVLALLAPRIATMFFIQMFFIVRDNLASSMGEGAVTALNYSWFIMQVPETLLGTAIAIAVLPSISEFIAIGDNAKFRDTINGVIRVLTALTIISAVLLALGLEPLIERVFDFGEEGTHLVMTITRVYLLGLAGHALLEIASRSFYARQDAITPLIAAMLNARLYISFAIVLSQSIGIVGIALSNTIIFTSEAILLLWLLELDYRNILKIGSTVWRVGLAALAAAGVFLLSSRLLPLSELFSYTIGMGAGVIAAFPFIWPELKILMTLESKSSQQRGGIHGG